MATYKDWMWGEDIRPYVFVRKENLPRNPGSLHKFTFPSNILMLDPIVLENSDFATAILTLEHSAFHAMGLTLPRWALYDCSVMPGLITGFAAQTNKIPKAVRNVLKINDSLEWTPISLFIAIPTAQENHWVAHNLCSVSSLLSKEDRYECLGYLSKAFGIWYFNIEHLYGVTQWTSTALRVHVNYGLFRLVTAYTPIHNFANTLTYLAEIDPKLWHSYLDETETWKAPLKPAGITVDPNNDDTLIQLHRRIEKSEGPFYLSPDDFTHWQAGQKYRIFQKA